MIRRNDATVPWWLLLALMPMLTLTTAQTDDAFVQTLVPCGGNTTAGRNFTGYVTIEAMNLDMGVELEKIRNGRPSQEPYIFVLCPDIVFDLSIEPLQPLLSGSVFTCGIDGNVTLDCEFRGGTDQIIVNALINITNYNLLSLNFIGITHTGFTNSAFSGTATSTTTIDITRSTFQNFNAQSVVSQSSSNDSGIAPFKVQLSDSAISNATGGNLFFNIGGELSIQDVVVTSSALMTFVTTGSTNTTEGSTFLQGVTIERSDITDVFIVMQAADIDAMDITIREMTDLVSVFDIAGDGSTAVLENININTNKIDQTNPDALWVAISVRDNAISSIRNSTFMENTNLRHIFSASNSAVLDIQNTKIVGASGGLAVNSRDISAGVFSNLQSSVTITNFRIDDTERFTSIYFAGFGSNLTIMNTCIGVGDNQGTIFISEESNYIAESNYIDPNFVSAVCAESGMRLIQELPNSGCFDVNRTDCDFNCTNFFDVDSCTIQIETSAPSITPISNMTLAPTIMNNTLLRPTFRPTIGTNTPRSVNASFVPTRQPVAITTKSPVGNKTSTKRPVSAPTTTPMLLSPSFTATSSPNADILPTYQPTRRPTVKKPSSLPKPIQTRQPTTKNIPPTLLETDRPSYTIVPSTIKPSCDCSTSGKGSTSKHGKGMMGKGKGDNRNLSYLSYLLGDENDDLYQNKDDDDSNNDRQYKTDDTKTDSDDDDDNYNTVDDNNYEDCICRESRIGKGSKKKKKKKGDMSKSKKGKGKGKGKGTDDTKEFGTQHDSSSSSSSSRVNHIYQYLEHNSDR